MRLRQGPPVGRRRVGSRVGVDAVHWARRQALVATRTQLGDDDDVGTVVEDRPELRWTMAKTRVAVDALAHLDSKRRILPFGVARSFGNALITRACGHDAGIYRTGPKVVSLARLAPLRRQLVPSFTVTSRSHRVRSVTAGVALVIVAAACGSSKTSATDSPKDDSTTTTSAPATTTMPKDMDHSGGKDGGDDHHHDDSKIAYAKLSATTKAEVDIVVKWASKYKTAADANKDGWVKATKSLYGIGSHYLKGGPLGFLKQPSEPNLAEPNVLLFDGEGTDAKLAGVSYIMNNPVNPEGFTGNDDSWHRHDAVCFVIKDMLVISEGSRETSPINLAPEKCKAKGGTMFPIANLTMMHLWVGDGYMGDYPIFAHDHPLLLDGYQPQKDV